MSAITGLEDISIAREDLQSSDSKDIKGFKSLAFAHEATGGETSIDLASLVTPATLSANGFVNPSPAEIAAAYLLIFRKNLRLYSSVRGRLHDFDSYVVSTNTRISFIGSILGLGGLLPGEIIKGELELSQAAGSLTADGRYFRVTYELPVGQTVIPLGVSYKVNDNPLQQGGAIRVFEEGKLLFRNVGNATAGPMADGNYQEINAGNGYGTSIKMNVAPGVVPRKYSIDIGLFVSDGSPEIFSSLERLAGIIQSMTADLALVTGEAQTKYMVASISELDRATYAAKVLSYESRIAFLEANDSQFVRMPASASSTFPTANTALFAGTALPRGGAGLFEIVTIGGHTAVRALKNISFSVFYFGAATTAAGNLVISLYDSAGNLLLSQTGLEGTSAGYYCPMSWSLNLNVGEYLKFGSDGNINPTSIAFDFAAKRLGI